jgi:hypothetical protein
MKKRIMVLMAVAALMVTMLAMSVAPAFAAWDGPCREGDFPYYHLGSGNQTALRIDRNDDGFVCATLSKPNDPLSDYRYYENRGYLVLP